MVVQGGASILTDIPFITVVAFHTPLPKFHTDLEIARFLSMSAQNNGAKN